MKGISKIGILLLFIISLSSCGIRGRGYYENPPTRRGRVIINDRRYDNRRYEDRRYDQRRRNLTTLEFSKLQYDLKRTYSENDRRRIIRSIPNYIQLSRHQAEEILRYERSEKQAIKMFKELIPHFGSRRDAERVADNFRNRKYRQQAFQMTKRVRDYNNSSWDSFPRSRW